MKRNRKGVAVLATLDWIEAQGLPLALATALDDGSIGDQDLLDCLPADECERAFTRDVAEERRHFVFRRSMQRYFLAQVMGWTGRLAELPLVQGLDQRPFCRALPDTCLSFSSSGDIFLFAAAAGRDIGVDVERIRPVADVDSLARRFFSGPEADVIAACADDRKSQVFLTLWSAKEAGLKAKGLGIVSGLNTFTFANHAGAWQLRDETSDAPQASWQLFLPAWRASHIVAVMHRPRL